ncbi:MAG: phage tail tape measure protein [Clostridiales bacterium]|nr:phage tail tape measure protein [Clostridiales bacterium]
MARTISTKLAIEGEAQYKQAVASCNSELSALKSNLTLVESEFRNNANSMAALAAKGTALGAVYDKQLEKVANLETALLNARNAVAAYAEKQADLKTKLDANIQAISAFDETTKKAGEQWAKYADELKKSESALEALKRKSGDTSSEQAQLEATIAKARAELERLETSTNGAARQVGKFLQENKQLSAEFEKNSAYLDAATRGANSWEKQLNSAKIELNGLSDEIEQNNQYLREAEKSADKCATSIDQYGKEVKEAGKSSEEFAAGAEQSKAGIEQLAAALAAAGVAATVKEISAELMACAGAAAGFETALAKLSTLIDTSVYPMEGIKAQLLELSNETGVAVGALAEAAYQARSAGVDAADVISFVSTATKTSVAGFTDSATAVDVLTTALNAYKLEGSEAERVASMLVKTQDEGKTSVGELAQNMGRIIPVAAAYNVSLENLNTSYALLTKNGTNTRIATTNLSAMFNELAKDGSTVADVLKEQTGKSFAELMDDGENLGRVMEILADSVDGDATAFSNLWSSTTAGQAALSLLNSGAEEFNRTLAVMANSSGAVDRNFQIMADTTEFAQQRMTNAAENLRIAIGDQLNPVLEDLYETGANAFTWATDFVEANPWVVSAITGLTVAFGVLAGGIAAVTAGATALKAALDLLSAHPLLLIATAAAGLTAAVYSYVTAAEAGQEATNSFYQSLRDAKAAYDDLMSSMEEEHASIATLADRLRDLMSTEEKSVTTKDRIKKTIDELNEAVPGLSLAYDEATDSIINYDDGVKKTTEDIDAMLDRTAKHEEYNAQAARLNELQDERAEISKRLAAAKEQLAGVEANDADMMERVAAAYEEAGIPMQTQEELAASLRATIERLTAAEADNAAQIAELEAATDAYNQGQGAAEAQVAAMTSRVDGLVAQMEELQASYQESYDAAYASIDSQLGLFNELDGTAKTSIDNLIATLQGQVDYMDTYAANLQRAMEMGVDEGLIAKLSDGKEESAQILAAIVKGGEDDIAALNAEFAKVEEGKQTFADSVAQMETDFDKKMGEIVTDLGDAIQEMDLQDKTYEIGQNNVRGLIEGTADPSLRKALVDEYIAMANDALAAYKAAVDQHSPSKEFAKAGSYDIQGLIEGAEAKKAELAAAYEGLAALSIESYADGMRKNFDAVAQAMAEFDEKAKSLSSFYSLRAEVGDLEYQLWERTDGRWASDMDKYAKQLELLSQKQTDQEELVKAANAAYEAAVAQYGEGAAESYEYQKALLEEKLAYEDLLDSIRDVTNAKHEAFIAQSRLAIQAEQAANSQASAAAYQAATQEMLVAQARHLPSTLEVPSASEGLVHHMESLGADMVNAIFSAANNGQRPIIVTKVMVPDGRVLAETTFDDLVDYGDANGTPIVNPSNPWR